MPRAATRSGRAARHSARHVFQRILGGKKIRTAGDITTNPFLIELNCFYSSDNYWL